MSQHCINFHLILEGRGNIYHCKFLQVQSTTYSHIECQEAVDTTNVIAKTQLLSLVQQVCMLRLSFLAIFHNCRHSSSPQLAARASSCTNMLFTLRMRPVAIELNYLSVKNILYHQYCVFSQAYNRRENVLIPLTSYTGHKSGGEGLLQSQNTKRIQEEKLYYLQLEGKAQHSHCV